MTTEIKEYKNNTLNIKDDIKFQELIKNTLKNPEILIKSKERVKNLAEVYTAKKEVNSMISLIPKEIWNKIDSTFLEPACGDGNFVEAIISKKLEYLIKPKQLKRNKTKLEYDILVTISTVYGIDICEDNIARCKERVKNFIMSYYSNNFNTLNPSRDFSKKLSEILNSNYIQGDTLNETEKILITQWERPVNFYFKKNIYRFCDLTAINPKPIQQEKSEKFYGKQ